MPPTYLSTRTQVETHVVLGTTTEGLFLEFKKVIEGPQIADQQARAKKAKELCRDITQFANAHGGCLLVGIEEGQGTGGETIALRIEPVGDVDGLRQWIEQAVANYCVPSTFTYRIEPVGLSQGSVVAVNVPPSLHPVYVWDRGAHTIECLIRNSHGKSWLNPDELERFIMDNSRAARLRFDAAVANVTNQDVLLTDGMWRWNQGAGWWSFQASPIQLGQRNESTFELRVPIPVNVDNRAPIISVVLPYGLVDEVWTDIQGRLNLLLSVRLHYGDREIRPVRPEWSTGRPGT